MAIKRIEALGLADVLGSLLGAVVDAQAQSARATVAFIEDIGFEPTTDGGKLRLITLRYSKRDENGQFAEFAVKMPLLAMVNVPSLAVKEAKLAFSYDVVVAAAGDDDQATSGPLAGRRSYQPAKLKGFIRARSSLAEHSSVKKTTSIDLDVTLGQQEVPIGVERLFELAELGIIEDKSE